MHFLNIIYFIFLMAGTLTVYHCPMRPIRVKPKKKKKKVLHFKKTKNVKKANIQGKYKVTMLRGSHKK